MTVAKGMHALGPRDGRVLVNVYKDGVAAKMGHDLTLLANSWSGRADLNPEAHESSSIQVSVEINSLEVLEGRGGAKALSEGDKADIKKNIGKTLGAGTVTFSSTRVSGFLPRLSVEGNLTVNGQSRPVTLDLTVDEGGRAKGTTSFNQTHFGIKPFSAMLGALKVKDAVDVSFDIQLPTA